jgi:hypothetical protein
MAGDGLLTPRRRVGDGLGDREAATGEIDAGGRSLKTTMATLGRRGGRPGGEEPGRPAMARRSGFLNGDMCESEERVRGLD